MKQRSTPTPRPVQHLQAIARRYPGLWPLVDRIRAGRGQDIDDWPAWCFMPLAGAYAIVSRHPEPIVADVGIIGALAAWRVTQGIYRFDPTVHEALASTPLETLPVEALYRLPEWCVYLETPDHEYIHGGFVHLEWDVNRKQPELRFVLDNREGDVLIPQALHLEHPTLDESLMATSEESERQALRVGRPDIAAKVRGQRDLMHQTMIPILHHLLGLALYLCAEAPELRPDSGPQRQPTLPRAKRTKKGERLFPPPSPTVWETGFELGARIRAARESSGEHQGGTVRGHIRRAHWHSFWKGPRGADSRELVVRWLPPIPVKLEGGVESVTVHRVRC